MDQYQSLRTIPWPNLAAALGIDTKDFRRDERKREWVGPCPIHGSQKNKGCFRYRDDGLYNCFSNGCKGSGALDLTMAVKQIGFKAACELLGGVQIPPNMETLHQSNSGAPRGKPIEPLSYKKHASWPCEWLDRRGITKETCDRFGVFLYDNPGRKSVYKGRVLIPFTNFETGKVDGYMARYIGDDAEQSKYLVPSGFPKSEYLLGAYEIKQAVVKLPVKVVLLVESPFTVCKLHQLGFCAVASYGWSVSEEQVQILRHLAKGAVWLPDRNKYEQASALAASLSHHLWLRFPKLPDGVDDPEHLSDASQIQALL